MVGGACWTDATAGCGLLVGLGGCCRWRAGAASSLEVMTGYTGEEELLFAKIFPKHYTCENEADLLRRVGGCVGRQQADAMLLLAPEQP